MSRTRPAYPDAFREQIIQLHLSGRSIASLAEEFEPCFRTIKHWCDQARATPAVHQSSLDATERSELQRLRKENKQLRQERDILSKAAAWFAHHPVTSPKSSNS